MNQIERIVMAIDEARNAEGIQRQIALRMMAEIVVKNSDLIILALNEFEREAEDITDAEG